MHGLFTSHRHCDVANPLRIKLQQTAHRHTHMHTFACAYTPISINVHDKIRNIFFSCGHWCVQWNIAANAVEIARHPKPMSPNISIGMVFFIWFAIPYFSPFLPMHKGCSRIKYRQYADVDVEIRYANIGKPIKQARWLSRCMTQRCQ